MSFAPPQTDRDAEVANPPTDSISSMAFSPTADLLAVGSWSNEIRIYEVGQNGQSQGKAAYSHEQPVLGVCWNKDGSKVFSGGADKAGRMFDITTGQSQQVATHEGPIKSIKWVETPNGGILATGSWDKTLKYWDLRTENPVATVQLPERCYTMDVTYPLLVVGTAERKIRIFNLANPTVPYKSMDSPLKWQTRVVATFPTGNGFALGSIEGRVAIQHVDDRDKESNFSFRCHRKEGPNKEWATVFAVNDIVYHPVHGTFATAGADGSVSYWDGAARTRLRTFDAVDGPISTTCFNRSGTIYAYAVSYDWSKGHTGMVNNHPNKIMLHPIKEEEVKKKNRSPQATR
ncbi:Poly(A)+ RNA export protein [Sistotremastrum niveocremeum HHB9708]|uniref:Poly(A)+ RNA export protein n=2 Tax=Sistotremastraceae TaxID=3402574 RepID=A0A164TX43_9AGAM|nr:Poly(A)+ RNA export protein [Sistotremastrum niveocremeum HHB9708]KZT41764.1 Poly(A)+ RNA export protein [Sistotremastrum suecicum HHB10207 ss-3]